MPPKNKKLGILGDPIEHSLSPQMHNAALQHLGLPYHYDRYLVRAGELKDFLEKMRSDFIGANVTIPHKEAVIPYLDQLTSEAEKIGAVNTIEVKSGRLIGHNTDADGFLESLHQDGWRGKRAVLIGSGGAAKAIATALEKTKVEEVWILNRTLLRGQKLAAAFQGKTLFHAQHLGHAHLDWTKIDLIVNATSLGMKEEEIPLPWDLLQKNTLIADIVYNPLKTPLLKKAKGHNLKALAGWGMLLYQGTAAFEVWFKRKAPTEVMKRALLEALHDSK